MRRQSFKQREGLEELPRALNKDEFPQALRNAIWNLLYECISPCNTGITGYNHSFSVDGVWRAILKVRYKSHRHKQLDLYSLKTGYEDLRYIYKNETSANIYNDLDFIISLNTKDLNFFRKRLKNIFDYYQCYYTIFFEGKDSIIAPRGTEQEKNTIEQCYQDLKKNNKFNGAKTHLISAVEFLNNNDYANSVKESISTVESVCRIVVNDEKATLSRALKKLKNKGLYIHPSMEEGIKKLYGYTSDEKGIRHSLLEDPKAKVDMVDAQYMIGSCASFASYLINKANNNNLFKQ